MICVIILKKENEDTIFIDTWFMSCRVLKRGMENFVLNTIVDYANENGYAYLKGQYLPTPKNQMVENHYFHLGFKQSADYWVLNVKDYTQKQCFIKAT